MENHDLTDIWQNIHPEEKQFTFVKSRLQKVFSHLYFLLLSFDLIGLTKECSIIPAFKTDHLNVEFSFHLRDNSKGTGYWRFDKPVLHDSTYALKIKDCIAETVQDNSNAEDDLLFNIMKLILGVHPWSTWMRKTQRERVILRYWKVNCTITIQIEK